MTEYAITWNISVPGSFKAGTVFLDIETKKVPTDGYVMDNGEPLRKRWQVILAGMACNGEINLVMGGTEPALLVAIGNIIGTKPVVYEATRDFDEMVLRGRFTNARRAHSKWPFYPHLPNAEKVDWRGMGQAGKGNTHALAALRSPDDLPGIEVPAAWEDGRSGQVMVHNLRDVVELIATYGEPDGECWLWCEMILSNPGFADDVMFGQSIAIPVS